MKFLEVVVASSFCPAGQAAEISNASTNLHPPIPIRRTLNEPGFVTLVIDPKFHLVTVATN